MTAEEQRERFRKAVRDAISAGDLNPTEADVEFDRLIDAALPPKIRAP